MDERERVLYSQEQKPRILETTLVELGVDTSFDNLNLAADKFTLGVKKVGEDTIFVGLLKHPLAGGHFAQLLNSVSPFPDQDVSGIIADINLPILAEHDYRKGKTTSREIQLHERHLGDPRVGPPYIRFAEDHATAWVKALGCATGWQVFDRLQRIRFINSREDVRRELFSEDRNIMTSLDRTECARMFSAIKKYGNLRYKFFCKRKGLKEYEYREREAIQSFLKTLSIGEQRQFAIMYFMNDFMDGDRQIFVDLETKRIRKDKNDLRLLSDQIEKGRVKFADNRRDVIISDGEGTKVVLTPTGQSSERFSWKVIEYQFPEGYEKSSLYPVVAWKKDENGTREFLTQKEAMPYVREFGLEEGEQGDTKLGEITVVSFARHIIKDWPAKMTLASLDGVKSRGGDDFEQPMRGGQMPAWVAVEQHIGQLLKSETSPLAVIERKLSL